MDVGVTCAKLVCVRNLSQPTLIIRELDRCRRAAKRSEYQRVCLSILFPVSAPAVSPAFQSCGNEVEMNGALTLPNAWSTILSAERCGALRPSKHSNNKESTRPAVRSIGEHEISAPLTARCTLSRRYCVRR